MTAEKIKQEVLEEICKKKQNGELPINKLDLKISTEIAEQIILVLDLAIQKTAEEIFEELKKSNTAIFALRINHDDWEEIKKKWVKK